ncbi:hypothetical protein CPB86DRAFT_791003 [Serendipita vermifera]|nr:hypothetical protein CPB86DRAFT_791003 [Serendipita vermifera]
MQAAVLQSIRRRTISRASGVYNTHSGFPRTLSTTTVSSFYRTNVRITAVDYGLNTTGLGSARNYWWSSKSAPPNDKTATEAQSLSKVETSSTPEVAAAPTSNVASTTSTGTPGSQVKDVASSSPLESVSATSGTELLQATDGATGTVATNTAAEAVQSFDSLNANIADLAAVASADYSHLFSFWPPGLFLRVYSWVEHIVPYSSHILCMAIAVSALRVLIVPLQIRAQKAGARFAPYQEEWTALQEKYQQSIMEKDRVRQMELAQRMLEIRKVADLKPFAAIAPAFGAICLGIGSFLGVGRLVIYHREVVEMGGVGPLANPGGLFGTGFLENLAEFSPTMLVIMTAITWVSGRRAAMDAPKYNKTMARMPSLMTPIALFFGYIAHFSAAQMIVACTSIGFNIAQSYLLRVPRIRTMVGMNMVPVQDSKTFVHVPLVSAWRETYGDIKNWSEKQALKKIEAERKLSEERAALMRSRGIVNKDILKVKDAPRSRGTPPPPPPPRSMPPRSQSGSSLFDGSSNSKASPSSKRSNSL